jgi:hypothetical protein
MQRPVARVEKAGGHLGIAFPWIFLEHQCIPAHGAYDANAAEAKTLQAGSDRCPVTSGRCTLLG